MIQSNLVGKKSYAKFSVSGVPPKGVHLGRSLSLRKKAFKHRELRYFFVGHINCK
jgi:hypothetical protein